MWSPRLRSRALCVGLPSTAARSVELAHASTGAAPRRAAAKASKAPLRAARDVRVRDGDAYGASGTSFYTTTEKQESYDALDSVLNAKCADAEVRTVIKEQLDACADITEALRSALVTVEGSSNTFGDAQLSVDVIADQIMWDAVKSSAVVAFGASEESPWSSRATQTAASPCAGIPSTAPPSSTTTGPSAP